MRKRDIFRSLWGGRYIIIAVGIIFAAAASFGALAAGRRNRLPEPPERAEEYLAAVESLDRYASGFYPPAYPYDGIDPSENDQYRYAAEFYDLRKNEIAMAYADIMTGRAAKDHEAVVESYSLRSASARAEAERLAREAEMKKSGADGSLEGLMDYAETGISSTDRYIEAMYCDNIVALMRSPSEKGADKRAERDIDSIYGRIDDIRLMAESSVPYELAALIGFAVGALAAAAVILLWNGAVMRKRLKTQWTLVSDEDGQLLDRINFKG